MGVVGGRGRIGVSFTQVLRTYNNNITCNNLQQNPHQSQREHLKLQLWTVNPYENNMKTIRLNPYIANLHEGLLYFQDKRFYYEFNKCEKR